MKAAILAVGSELLSTDRLDTNSLAITERLERYGIELVGKRVVGDDEPELAAELRSLLPRVDLVLVSGGLGPTADDVTREAVADALGRSLVHDPATLAAIERRFAALGRTMAATNRKQADLVEGATKLINRKGTAPGQRLEAGATTLFLLPGVPHELVALLDGEVEPWLAAATGGAARETLTLKVALLPESEVDERLQPVYEEFGRSWITLLAGAGEVKIRLTALGSAAERGPRLAAMAARVRERLGEALFGEGAEATLEGVIGESLVRRGWTISTAESCTGGLVAERLTRIPGSSRYFPGGLVVYANEAKSDLAGVDPELVRQHGAVSEPVARALAVGVRARFRTCLGVGITGIAGPGGGSPEKPVGTVWIALAGPGDRSETLHFRWPGDRERVRALAAQAALDLVRRRVA
ncbi:MAG: competence/damage-inducible protein A [Thermoanaerobaculia bacterium]